MESKISKVKEYLEKNKSITSWDAFVLFQLTRLSSVIFELRHKYKMNIITEPMRSKRSNYAKYILVEEN